MGQVAAARPVDEPPSPELALTKRGETRGGATVCFGAGLGLNRVAFQRALAPGGLATGRYTDIRTETARAAAGSAGVACRLGNLGGFPESLPAAPCDDAGMSMRSIGLSRPRENAWIAGVCAGVADRFEVPAWLVRLVFVVSCLLPGPQFIIYIALWILMPRR